MDVREGGAARPSVTVTPATTMITWAALDGSRLEAVRLGLGGRGMRATGAVVALAGHDQDQDQGHDQGHEAYSVSYTLATDEAGLLARLAVRATTAGGERHVNLSRSDEGMWLVDHGAGARRTDFDGAVDVGLTRSPLFTAMPVRRVGLHRTPRECELAVVFVGLPSLRVELVRQSYRTVSVGERPVVAFSGGGVEAELTLDAEGVVVDYPGLARRG